MGFGSMIQELLGVSGMNRGLAATRVNEAFQKIQNEQVWSFQCISGGWLTANLLGGPNTRNLSPGTITVTPFDTSIYGDPIATAAWNAAVPYPPFLTQQQIRSPYYSLYNIISMAPSPTVSYVIVTYPGLAQTPGIYVISGTNAPGDTTGSGAQIQIIVGTDGTVSTPPVLLSGGQGYTLPPIFTPAAGGALATFQSVLQAVITIDRPWMEPPQVNGSYMIYQAYYPAPPGFKRWWSIRDVVNNNNMDFWTKTQIDLANDDPQRTIFDQPYYVVPLGQDTRPGSATLGQLLVELWPHPTAQLPYTFGCQANWPALVNPNDVLPYPLTEELVKFRAYELINLWKESQKGDEMERGSGANWQFLAQANKEEYREVLKQIRIMDRHLIELYFTKARVTPPYDGEPFATVNGMLNVGTF